MIDLAAEETRLRAVVADARALAAERPTGKNRKALRLAQKALDAFIEASAQPEGFEVLAGVQQVVDYLDAGGWKVAKSSVYEHWKKEGKIKARPDGGFDLVEVDAYARKHLQRKDGSVVGEDLAEEKRREEILRIRADRLQRELRYKQDAGELMPRNLVEVELSERATHLRNYLDAVARSSAGRVCKILGGDPQKLPELICWWLGMNKRAMDNYARPIAGIEEGDDEE